MERLSAVEGDGFRLSRAPRTGPTPTPGNGKLFRVTPDEQARRERAAKRAKVIVLHKGRLGHPEVDFTPVRGAAAISLTTRLTMESFSLARLDSLGASRSELPVRFVPRPRA